MTTFYVTVELSITDEADDEAIADAIFEVLVSGEWLVERSELNAMIHSVNGTTYERAQRPRNIKVPPTNLADDDGCPND